MSTPLMVAVLVVSLLVGCTDETRSGGNDAGSGAASGTAANGASAQAEPIEVRAVGIPQGEAGIPGLYLTSDIAVFEVSESHTLLMASRTCPELFDVLGAGEWTLTSTTAFPANAGFLSVFGFGFTATAVLEWDDRALLVKGIGGGTPAEAASQAEGAPPPELTNHCRATIEPLTAQRLVFEGAVTAEGDARHFPTRCMAIPEEVYLEVGYQGPGALWTQLKFAAPRSEGQHTISGESIEGALAPIDVPVWEYYEQAMIEAGGDLSLLEEGPEGWIELFAAAEQAGSVTVESIDPFQGTVDLTELITSEGSSQSIQAGFRCGAVAEIQPGGEGE